MAQRDGGSEKSLGGETQAGVWGCKVREGVLKTVGRGVMKVRSEAHRSEEEVIERACLGRDAGEGGLG
jgi:hypothetical protein